MQSWQKVPKYVQHFQFGMYRHLKVTNPRQCISKIKRKKTIKKLLLSAKKKLLSIYSSSNIRQHIHIRVHDDIRQDHKGE